MLRSTRRASAVVRTSPSAVLPRSSPAGRYLRFQQRQFLPLLLGGAATVCVVGFVGIAGIVIGDNLYRNYKEAQQLKQQHAQVDKKAAKKQHESDDAADVKVTSTSSAPVVATNNFDITAEENSDPKK